MSYALIRYFDYCIGNISRERKYYLNFRENLLQKYRHYFKTHCSFEHLLNSLFLLTYRKTSLDST